uniref:Eukaryotic translation initiation factor 2 subunit 2 n=1 Tax=Cricetulus griseus TaxID=10029 RepID=A0A8C2QKR1_CRIGR
MSRDGMVFDGTMSKKKKKKKKKKKPFMLDKEGDAQTEETQPSETKEVEPEPTEDKDVEADEADRCIKRKRRKKKIFDIDEAKEDPLSIESDTQEPAEPEDDLDIMLGNKKKKKKNVKFPDEDEILEKDQTGPAWAGLERDYSYEELLNRVFNIMREKNPDMVAGEKRKFVMKPPQVVRVGTKKTFVNCTDICKLLHCQPKHLLEFLLADLGTSGSIDGNNQRYIKEYVTCYTFRGERDIFVAYSSSQLCFVQCETCHSRCSIASIKTGFQAVHRQASTAPCQS